MLIIAGYLVVAPQERDAYLIDAWAAVEAARVASGCLAFSLSADLIEPGRICIFERWESEEQLLAFRRFGPSDEQQTAILDADVKRYTIFAVGDP